LFSGSLWRIGVLLVSLVGHWFWFSQDIPKEQTLKLAGGAQSLPIAVRFSIASVAAVPKRIEKQPIEKQSVGKPKQRKSQPVKPLPGITSFESEIQAKTENLQEDSQREVVEEVVQQELPNHEEGVAAQSATTAEQPQGLESIPVLRGVSYRQPPAPPVYPKTALRRRQQGEVWLQALVSPEGKTEQVEVVRSSGVSSLDDSALRAVSSWVFEAAKMDGRPIRAWIEVPVAFELRR
jgi:periplasmic protein TonB